MITLMGYIVLRTMFGETWTEWLMALTVLQDLVILGRLNK